MLKENSIFICGHNGMVGSAINKKLLQKGFSNIITASRDELDLTNQSDVKSFFNNNKPDYVFLAAAKANGVSKFSHLGELNKKESPRLKLGSQILNKLGIKTKLTKDSIKIFGDPTVDLKKSINIKNYYKDHRIFMTSVIAAFTFGGKWKIDDVDSYKSSFPSFLNIIKKLGYKFKFVQ